MAEPPPDGWGSYYAGNYAYPQQQGQGQYPYPPASQYAQDPYANHGGAYGAPQQYGAQYASAAPPGQEANYAMPVPASYYTAATGLPQQLGNHYSSEQPQVDTRWRANQPFTGSFMYHQQQSTSENRKKRTSKPTQGNVLESATLQAMAPKGMAPANEWPPALRDLVESVFQRVRSSSERAKAQEWMKTVIDDAKQKNEIWTRDWRRVAIPSFVDMSAAVLTCPICNSQFVPAKQFVDHLNEKRAKKRILPIQVPRKWSQVVTVIDAKQSEWIPAKWTPEAVAAKWTQQFGAARWEDYLHEQCLDTLCTKAKEFQDQSGMAYPKILHHKWIEIQKWAKHCNNLAERAFAAAAQARAQRETATKVMAASPSHASRKKPRVSRFGPPIDQPPLPLAGSRHQQAKLSGNTTMAHAPPAVHPSRHKNINPPTLSFFHPSNTQTTAGGMAPHKQKSHKQKSHKRKSQEEIDEEEDFRQAMRKRRFGETALGGNISNFSVPPHAAGAKKKNKQRKNAKQAAWDHAFSESGTTDGPIVGTCELMCPIAEIHQRTRMNEFDALELPSADFPGRNFQDLAVKRFARTITEEDRRPDRLRTKDALRRTMHHLVSLMNSNRLSFEKVHRFLWDRYRAIRTDLSIQHIKDEFAVQCYEEMIRFHIMAEHELCEETATVTNPHGFNSHLNVEQMYKCLTSLFTLYDDLAKAGRHCAHEPEFRAYHILLTMDTHGKYRRDESALSFALSKMRPAILRTTFVRFAVQVNAVYHSGNFAKFFKVVRNCPFLVCCILHAYFVPIRQRCLQLLDRGIFGKSAPMALTSLKQILLMDSNSECGALVRGCGLSVKLKGEHAGVQVGQRRFAERQDQEMRKRSAFITKLRKQRKYSAWCKEPAPCPDLLW